MLASRDPLPTDRELKTSVTGKDAEGNEWSIVLFRAEDGLYWYQLPVADDDPATATLFGEFDRRRDATAGAREHLKELD
jgi:hypothetical protein